MRFTMRMLEQAVIWLLGALVLWTPTTFVGIALIGIVYARNLEFAHECLHATALPRPRHNAIAGTLLCLPMLVSFTSWRREHMRHHADVRIEGFHYEYPRLTTWTEYAIHALMLRHFRSAGVSLAALVLATTTVAAILHSWVPVLLFLAPLPIAAIVHTHVELPEHFGLEAIGSRDPLENSRVIPANRFVTWFVNANNYHAIHHWKPSLPISRLRATYETMTPPHVSSYRAFYRAFYAGLFTNR